LPYIVTLTDGTILTTVADTTVDNTSSLTLLGRNFSVYGGYIANDLVHLLENFAYTTPPPNPLVGQLWYNTTLSILEIWNGSAWNTSDIRGTGITEVATDGALPAPTSAATALYLVDAYNSDDGLPALASRLGSNWYYYPSYVKKYAVDSGTVNTMVAALSPAPGTLASLLGIPINVKVANTNTGTTTLNLNSFGAVTLVTGNNTIAIPPGLITAGSIISVIYDGTHFQLISSGSPGLVFLAAPLTINVATSGNDTTGNGTSAAPFASINGAWQYLLQTYNVNSYGVTIQVANGTYNSAVALGRMPNGAGTVQIVGNPGSPSSCTISITSVNDTVAASGNVNVLFNGFTLSANVSNTTNYGTVINTGGGAVISIQNITFGLYTNFAMISSTGGQIAVGSNISVTNGVTANGLFYAHACGVISASNTTINIGTGVSLGVTANVNECGVIEAIGLAWTGNNSTGTRYSASTNGVILTNGGGANYFVGTVAGATSSGGQYT
jgi:hypothetical protein